MNFKIRYSCMSHIGNMRHMNQDNFVCDGVFFGGEGKRFRFPIEGAITSKNPSVFGVFDGMGGEERGEIASYIAAKSAASLKIGRTVVADLSRYCEKTNTAICDFAFKHGISAMGTTAAILVFAGKKIVLCNIGDSKIFRYRKGILEQISKDHLEVAPFGVKPPLSQNLGIPPDELIIEPYFAREICKENDCYLICSDGLTDMVATTDIAAILEKDFGEDAIMAMMKKALLNGGKDNITMILCHVVRDNNNILRREGCVRWM